MRIALQRFYPNSVCLRIQIYYLRGAELVLAFAIRDLRLLNLFASSSFVNFAFGKCTEKPLSSFEVGTADVLDMILYYKLRFFIIYNILLQIYVLTYKLKIIYCIFSNINLNSFKKYIFQFKKYKNILNISIFTFSKWVILNFMLYTKKLYFINNLNVAEIN